MPQTIISEEDVKKITALGKLRLTEEEIEKATHNLSDILGHFSQIQNIDTAKVPMADDVSGLKNITREDAAQENLLCTAEELLQNAPLVKDNQLQVHAVFDQE